MLPTDVSGKTEKKIDVATPVVEKDPSPKEKAGQTVFRNATGLAWTDLHIIIKGLNPNSRARVDVYRVGQDGTLPASPVGSGGEKGGADPVGGEQTIDIIFGKSIPPGGNISVQVHHKDGTESELTLVVQPTENGIVIS